MECLYDVNICHNVESCLGRTEGLHQGIFTMNNILRVTPDPKAGDASKIKGSSKKLLICIDQNSKFNIMDCIFRRIAFVAYDREKYLPFDRYIQLLINHVAKDKVFALDKEHKKFKTTKEINMFDPKKMEVLNKLKNQNPYVPRKHTRSNLKV